MNEPRRPRSRRAATSLQAENQSPEPQAPETSDNRPDYLAYQIRQGEDGSAYWTKIGAAWKHKDGEGYELDLAALPVNGRVSLRTLREHRMQDYRDQQTDRSAPEVTPSHAPQR